MSVSTLCKPVCYPYPYRSAAQNEGMCRIPHIVCARCTHSIMRVCQLPVWRGCQQQSLFVWHRDTMRLRLRWGVRTSHGGWGERGRAVLACRMPGRRSEGHRGRPHPAGTIRHAFSLSNQNLGLRAWPCHVRFGPHTARASHVMSHRFSCPLMPVPAGQQQAPQ